jgi:hydroxymethylpyrimidine pyrophosphatase-like HAD family hydrolase
MPPVELVVTDLDGTLWHTDDAVHERTLAALVELERRAVPLLVATGRRVTSTRVPLARFGLAPPAVVLNGALRHDHATDERFHRAAYAPDEAVAVMGALAAVGLQPVVYVDHPRWDAFLAPAPSPTPEHVRQLGATATTDDLARVAAEEVVLGFGMIGVPMADGEAAASAAGDLAEVHLDRSIDYTGLASLTIAPRGQSKRDGVRAFCALHGLREDRVLAVADGPNDLELLDQAAVSVVPAVAHPAALERADHVVPAAVDGGWADLLAFLG